ncbi:hypothetical protein SLP22_0036 [Salmonella phage BAU.Micro_SLP-22]|nr:hypothetical protein SLP22_00041 [Salmonella phage BAU.Micro_SLP-22]
MGLIHTESWQRFPNDTPMHLPLTNNANNAASNYFLTEKEYSTRQAQGAQDIASTGSTAIRTPQTVTDPVEADKQRLVWPGTVPASMVSTTGVSISELVFTFPTAKTHYIVGFLVRVDAGTRKRQTPAGTFNLAQALIFAANLATRYSNSDSFLAYGFPSNTHNIFTVHNGSTQTVLPITQSSSFAVKPTFTFGAAMPTLGTPSDYDTDYFIEIEVDTVNRVLNIWKDDVLVGQPSWRTSPHDTLKNGFSLWMTSIAAASGFYSNEYGGIMLSDLYVIDCNDGIAPTTRLGSSTRVRGEAPNKDIRTDFTRPDGYDSNAAVVSQKVTPGNPTVFLQADGDNATDIYQTDKSNISQYAGKIYGVTIRTRSANASVSPHSMAIVTKDAQTESETSLGVFGPTDGFKSGKVVLATDPSGNEWTVPNAANLQYGLRVKE